MARICRAKGVCRLNLGSLASPCAGLLRRVDEFILIFVAVYFFRDGKFIFCNRLNFRSNLNLFYPVTIEKKIFAKNEVNFAAQSPIQGHLSGRR
ncbi:hypothetical protein EBU99_13355 [bacterium]|nr:hypothetical protein [bacterium]